MRRLSAMVSALIERLSGRHAGVYGALFGFAVALLWVHVGFFRMLFVLLMTAAGYVIGVRFFSNRDAIRNWLERLFPPGFFR